MEGRKASNYCPFLIAVEKVMGNLDFPPGLMNQGFDTRRDKVNRKLGDMFCGASSSFFEQLCQQFDIVKHPFLSICNSKTSTLHLNSSIFPLDGNLDFCEA